MVISRFGKRFAQARSSEILTTSGSQAELSPNIPVSQVSSANGSDCLDLIAAKKPDVVFLAGCRMLSKDTLAAIPCPVLNYHSGINPKYRGLAKRLVSPGRRGPRELRHHRAPGRFRRRHR